MYQAPYNTDAPRKPTNLSVNTDLLAQARELGINLSGLFEESLARAVRDARREAWLTENREALEEYNQRVAKQGSFGDQMRRF